MKLTKENVCVFIKDETQLEEARKMLEKYGEIIDNYFFRLTQSEDNFLQYFPIDNDWGLAYQADETQITLQQLEEILKKSK